MKRKVYTQVKSGVTAFVLGCLFIACDKNFEEINTNPDASTTITPAFVFSKAQVDLLANTMYPLLGAMHYTTSFNDVAGFGSKYLWNQQQQSFAVFNNGYINEVNELEEVIRAVQQDPTQVNLYAMARIWRVLAFSRMTDLYGDIPYSEAAKGYVSGNYAPKYDTQASIYADLLTELEQAAEQLDAAADLVGTADLVYAGNTDQWKKFAYSLMLRLSMRLTKVDPQLSEVWAKKAIAGGVILANNDAAKITYSASGQDINKNPVAFTLLTADYLLANGSSNSEGGKFHKTFIDRLKQLHDPRLGILSVVYVNGRADTSFAIQKGMPANLSSKPSDFVSYSEPNQASLLKLDAPLVVCGNSEMYFLLAEAAVRGWYTEDVAAALYQSGIRASLENWASVGAAGQLSAAAMDTYLTANVLPPDADREAQLEAIYTQFWLAIFPDVQEAFATYRRTGYPELPVNNYPGSATDGYVFRRMMYPLTEENLNPTGYNEAIARQGINNFTTRIWWDQQ